MNRRHPKNIIKRQIRRNSTSKRNLINNENKEVSINKKYIRSNRIIKVNDINNYSHNYKTKESNEVHSEGDYKSKQYSDNVSIHYSFYSSKNKNNNKLDKTSEKIKLIKDKNIDKNDADSASYSISLNS